MRWDMAKQICERERRGSKNGEMYSRFERRGTKNKLRKGSDDFDNFQSIKKHVPRFEQKELNENLNPLRRFLLKNVGRPWNKVHSEICENIKLSNTVQRHILQHVEWDVELHVKMVDGNPYVVNKYGMGREWKPLTGYGRRPQLYVNPDTGLLQKAPEGQTYRQRQRAYRNHIPSNRFFPADNLLIQYWKLDGIWYEIQFREPTEIERQYHKFGHLAGGGKIWVEARSRLNFDSGDFHNNLNSDHPNLPYHYFSDTWDWYTTKSLFGRNMFPVNKRQLKSKEVKKVEKMIEYWIRKGKK